MRRQILLGALIATIMSGLFWSGNAMARTVLLFPDVLTVLILPVLLAGAVLLCLQHVRRAKVADILRVSLSVASIVGMGFGSAVVLMGIQTFARPGTGLAIFSFGAALISSLAGGLIAGMFLWLFGRLLPAT